MGGRGGHGLGQHSEGLARPGQEARGSRQRQLFKNDSIKTITKGIQIIKTA